MEVLFVIILVVLMASALASGYPVAFALPGSAIITIFLAAASGYIFAGDMEAYFAFGGPQQWLNAGITNFRGIYWEADRDTLIAIPLFVFMGIMLERSKIAEDLLVTMAQLFGPLPGGLGISVVFVGALLAATTGIVGATVIAMGLISLPVMMRAKYSNSLATGTISASGTLGQIIPPSIVLIILADQLASATDQAQNLRQTEYKAATGEFALPAEFSLTSTSAGDMFMGAFIPGLVLVGIYIIYILVMALIRPGSAPPVRHEGEFDAKFWLRVMLVLVPPFALIFAVLGSIILGVATVNQAGAIGAVGAMIMAGYRLREGTRTAFYPAIIAVVSVVAIAVLQNMFELNIKSIDSSDDVFGITLAAIAVVFFAISLIWSGWRVYKIDNTLQYVMVETAKTSALVFIILLGAAMLTAAFRAFGGEELVKEFLTGLPGGFLAKFALVMVVIFVLGFFLDFIEIAVVVVPIIAPILLADPEANITAVWLGVMIGVNMQTSFLTPPFGFALFYLRGVAPPEVKTTQIYRGVVPFIGLQLAALVIVGMFPAMVNYIPNRVTLTAETAPPPMNPRLQHCLEGYLFEQYDERESELLSAIGRAASLDISYLPEDRRETLNESFEAARSTFDLIVEIREAEAALDKYAEGYRPLHREVRRSQAEMRNIDVELEDLEQTVTRLTRFEDMGDENVEDVKQRIEDLKIEKTRLEESIPAEWEEEHARYKELADAADGARNRYRRNVDDAYEPIPELRTILSQAEQLDDLRDRMDELPSIVANDELKETAEKVDAVEDAVGEIEDNRSIKSPLSKAERALDNDEPDREKAANFVAEALKAYGDEVEWRLLAAEQLSDELASYDEAITDTIGLRMQPRLSTDQASEIAGCLSVHRDISLHF